MYLVICKPRAIQNQKRLKQLNEHDFLNRFETLLLDEEENHRNRKISMVNETCGVVVPYNHPVLLFHIKHRIVYNYIVFSPMNYALIFR